MIHAVDLYSRQLTAACSLTGPQLACLRHVESAGAETTTGLAAAVSLSPATVSGILDRLEARELICRERQSDDKRRVLVTLTETGRSAVRQAPPSLQEQFSAQFRALSPCRQARIEGALREVVGMMEAETLEPPPLLVPSGVSTNRQR
jgi:DNA-binding MarR family transcriptional regulator